MNLLYSFKELSSAEKESLRTYSDKKKEKLARFLDRIHPEVTVELRAEKFAKKNAYRVSFALVDNRAPRMAASEDDHTIHEAFDLAEAKFVEQIKKFTQRKDSSTRESIKMASGMIGE